MIYLKKETITGKIELDAIVITTNGSDVVFNRSTNDGSSIQSKTLKDLVREYIDDDIMNKQFGTL